MDRHATSTPTRWRGGRCCPSGGAADAAATSGRSARGTGRVSVVHRHRVPCERSLAVLHPDLAGELHPSRNGDLDPYAIGLSSSLKAVMALQRLRPRVEGVRGGALGGRRRLPKLLRRGAPRECSLAALRPDLAAELHRTQRRPRPPKPSPSTFGVSCGGAAPAAAGSGEPRSRAAPAGRAAAPGAAGRQRKAGAHRNN
jgi:hypothetical protein